MIDLKHIYESAKVSAGMLTESKKTHLKHLFEDGTMTFDDMRNIFKQVFTGKVGLTRKVKTIPLMITYKDGNFMMANDDHSVKTPFSVDKVCAKCKCKGPVKEALTDTMNKFVKRLNSLEQVDLNSIFANGQNYVTLDVIVPPESNLADYGNRCFLQCNGVNCYDSTFKNMVEDEENSKKISEKLAWDKASELCQSDLSPENIERLKASTSPDVALQEVLKKLEEIVDGIGYKATVNDYVRERFAKYIVNAALKRGIDLYHNSDFVKELIARLSYTEDHRPSRADLITYAKKDGVNYKSDEYSGLINDLEEHAEETNDAIIRPVEELALKAGILVMKCLLGMVAADPRRSAQKLCPQVDATVKMFENESDGLTPEKIKAFRTCMKSLDKYQSTLPKEGILVSHRGKICRLVGTFGLINNIMKLVNY